MSETPADSPLILPNGHVAPLVAKITYFPEVVMVRFPDMLHVRAR